jgi:hypothetical protein
MMGRFRDAMRRPWRGQLAGTLRDLGEISWGVGLLLAVVGGLGWLSRAYFGPLAWRVTLGLGAVILVVFLTIVLANVLAVLVADLWRAYRPRRR